MAGLSHRTIRVSFLALLFCAGSAVAQENERGFLEQLFGNSDRAQEGAPADPSERGNANAGRLAQSSDLAVRLDRLEAHIRQLTGAIEQLQYRNQQLEGQLRRMQQDAEYRVPEGPPRGTPPARPGVPVQPMQPQATQPQATQPQATQPQATQPYSPSPLPAAPGPRRGDAFDPSLNPNAPGAPRPLGTTAPSAPLAQSTDPEEPVGAPGGRTAGAPLDLSTLTGLAGNAEAPPAPRNPGGNPGGPSGGAQVATLPPTDSPKDTYDLAYGYILRREYALAEDTFRQFLRRFPNDRLSSDAQYWLGESLFQRQRYRDAAELFLNVSTKFETAAKAPDSLLRLGQSLAGLGEKDAACASLAEVGRKYPRASVSVKQGVEREQKRVRC